MIGIYGERQLSAKKWEGSGQIRQFYAGKKILLTGTTGFFGTCILEKLLRTCVEVDKIYITVRSKRNLTIEERLKKYFQSDIFDKVRQINPNFTEKVVTVSCDLLRDNLGLSPEDRCHLQRNIDIIIHNAANVRFDERISKTLRTNVLGTHYMLQLAAECHQLKAFIYVSTAYSNCYNKIIEEKFYPCPVDLKMIEDIIRADEENENGISDAVIREIIGQHPNTYTFSKSVAETLVKEFPKRTSISCAVFRPTIIASAINEPLPGWISNKNGPVLPMLSVYLGLGHICCLKEKSILDVIPVDLTVNCLLASTWDVVTYRKTEGVHVYNYGSSCWKPCNLVAQRDIFFDSVKEFPSTKTIWYPFLMIFGNFYIFMLFHLLFHVVPAALCDLVSLAKGKGAMFLSTVWKYTRMTGILYYFINGDWLVRVDNCQGILIRMNAVDYKEFNFDLGRIEWRDYVRWSIIGLKVNIMKEPLDTIPAAKEKLRSLKLIHYTVSTLFFFAIVYILRIILIYPYC